MWQSRPLAQSVMSATPSIRCFSSPGQPLSELFLLTDDASLNSDGAGGRVHKTELDIL